jgi:hypothetical protein
MENLTRRLFLGRSAAVGAISLTGAAVASEAISATVEENPQLLRLCDEFDSAYLVYQKTAVAKRDAVARFEALAPEVPPALVPQPHERHLADFVTDIDGKYIWRGTSRDMLITSHDLERDHHIHGWQHKSVKAKLPIAKAYEAAVEKAREDPGVNRALEMVWRADTDVRRAMESVKDKPAFTSIGIMRKAIVAHAYAGTSADNRARVQFAYSQDFWAEIVAVLGKEVAS